MRHMGEMIQKTKSHFHVSFLKKEVSHLEAKTLQKVIYSAAFSRKNRKVSINNRLLLWEPRNQVGPLMNLLPKWDGQHENSRAKPHPGSAETPLVWDQQCSCPCSSTLVSSLEHSPRMWRFNWMVWTPWIPYQTFFLGVKISCWAFILQRSPTHRTGECFL